MFGILLGSTTIAVAAFIYLYFSPIRSAELEDIAKIKGITKLRLILRICIIGFCGGIIGGSLADSIFNLIVYYLQR